MNTKTIDSFILNGQNSLTIEPGGKLAIVSDNQYKQFKTILLALQAWKKELSKVVREPLQLTVLLSLAENRINKLKRLI